MGKKMGTKPCPYWVWSRESNVHVAESASWFTDYTPFKSVVQNAAGESLAVAGIGTVDLSIRCALRGEGPSAFSVYKMENVLHVPSAPGNIVGGPAAGYRIKYDISPAGRHATSIVVEKTGRVFGYFHAGWEDLRLLRVAGTAEQQCNAEEGSAWLRRIAEEQTSMTWAAEARAGWESRRAASDNGLYQGMTAAAAAAAAAVPLTDSAACLPAAPAWLKEHFSSEHSPLEDHDVFIHVKSDRHKARQLARALIASGCMRGDPAEGDLLAEHDLFICVAPQGRQQGRQGWQTVQSMTAAGCMGESATTVGVQASGGERSRDGMARRDKASGCGASLVYFMSRIAVSSKQRRSGAEARDGLAVLRHQDDGDIARQWTRRRPLVDYTSDGGDSEYETEKSAGIGTDWHDGGRDELYYMDQWPALDGVRETECVPSRATASDAQLQQEQFSLLD